MVRFEKIKRKTIFLFLSLIFILTAIFYLYFFLEDMIYWNVNSIFPGDCGHFVVWMSSILNGKESDPRKITYQINPLVILTGPITIKKNLNKLGIEAKFYNNFSTEEIKRKLDENKNVIVTMNVNQKSIGAGATHYLFFTDYDENGFYFFDSFYFGREYHKTGKFEPYFFTFDDFENKRRNVLNISQIVGWIENVVGFKNFVIVIGEQGEDNLNVLTKAGLISEYILEKIIELVGRTVVLISPRI